MQVNVFVSDVRQDGEPAQLLVLPYGPLAAIPGHLQNIEWRYLATTEADDRIIGLPAGEVEVALANDGYVVVAAKVTERR
jgi:hypothetical protein